MIKSLPVKISLKITAVISLFLILLFVCFTCLLRLSLNNAKSSQLQKSAQKIANYIEENETDSSFFELPYFISYSVFDSDENVIFSNDNFIPKLLETDEKTVHHFVKNFYIDGNLDILYLTKKEGDKIIQVSIDIENDSAAKMIYSLPFVIFIVMIPVSILIFFILYLFIKKDFQREQDFSANVSHELQTPVNAILGHANLLNRWGKNDEKQLETSLNVIISESHLMKATITNLLQITKLEKSMIELQKEPIFIQEFFDLIKNEFKYEKELEIRTFIQNQEKNIVTDKTLLHQIFVIAISNSLKFSPRPCIINLTFKTENSKSVFEIEDNGKGFSKEILPHIFERFYRGDESHSRSKGGAGLGLSIAKSISDILNAKISAKNSDFGGVIRIEF